MIILVGPSASGKTYIGKCLEKIGFHKIVTYTTRQPRTKEINGVDYYFLTKLEFLNKIEQNFFFEYVIYNNNYYGTSNNSIKDINSYLIVEPQGLKKYLNIPNCVAFFIECPEDVLKERMKKRGDSELEIAKRIVNDRKIFNSTTKKLCHYQIDGNASSEKIIKEIEDKYYGCLNLAKSH